MLEADTIAAERRIRRQLRFWRIGAVVAAAVALLVLSIAVTFKDGQHGSFSNHIARIKVSGLILGDPARVKMIEKLASTERVKAVIVEIDSPGGTISGSEDLYLALRKLAKEKPVVAVMKSVAASGGYIAALASDRIIASGNTITGSIGVIFQWAQLSKLLNSAGIEMHTVKSGELKAQPNMFEPMPDKAKAVTEAMVQDSFQWFTGLVETRRKLSKTDVLRLADGRVYTGRQALKEKLIDALGGEDQALKWLHDKHDIDKSLEISDWKPKRPDSGAGLGLHLAAAAMEALGLDGLARPLRRTLRQGPLVLDGLMAVWHPELHQGQR